MYTDTGNRAMQKMDMVELKSDHSLDQYRAVPSMYWQSCTLYAIIDRDRLHAVQLC